MSDIIPLFGQHRTQSGQQLGGALARQTRREVDQVAARTEVSAVEEQGRAFLASVALTHSATLISQAEAHMRIAPAGQEFYADIITAYAQGAASRVRGFH